VSTEDQLAAAIATVPELNGADRIERLGGMTNANFKVSTPAGSFVVRVDAPDSEELEIDRESELANCEAASRAGVGAPFVAWLPEHHVLVMRFLDGRTLTPADLQRGDRLADVAALLRRLHETCTFRGGIDMFTRQRHYLASAVARGCTLPDGYLRYSEHVERIERAFAEHPMPVVACHNDLVAENFVDTSDGLRLIDYDYAGANDPCSDLGDVWSESKLSAAQLDELIGHYFGEPHPALIARARLWALMSKYGWSTWAVLRQTDEPDPDVMRFLALYDEAAAEFDSDEFEQLLERAAGLTPAALHR
jgi:thiamine kinase-like enzyme